MIDKRWNVGLLGAGYICEAHAKALTANANTALCAICDRSPVRARKAADLYGIPQVFTSLDDMLNANLDVVHVLLPPDGHFSAARAILESGRHVFLEKPMATTAGQCQELVELAEQKQLRLGVNHNFLFLRAYESLRKDVRDKVLGRLDHITLHWLFPLGLIQSGPFDNWILREPNNLFLELGPHLVACLLDLVGPLDRVVTDVFRPIDLPGGNRIYRRWHVHGVSGETGVDLNLSVLPGYPDRSITVRGHGAVAKCELDRDVYLRAESSGASVHFDGFLTTERLAWQYASRGMVNLTRSLFGKFKKTPSADPYFESIARSVATFYQGLTTGSLDARVSGSFGVTVLQTLEEIAARANLEPAPTSGASWTVQPPRLPSRVLVIGGTGFIGKHLVRTLVARDVGVRVLTRNYRAGQLALAGLPVDLMEGNLADAADMDKALSGIEVVYHLAKADGKNWNDYYTQDVLVTQTIAERALAHGVKRFFYTGTIDSYYSGDPNEVITGDTPLDPQIERRNLYARSKAACEALLTDLYRTQGLPLVIFRPGIVIGKGCPPAHWGIGMFESDTRVKFWGDGNHPLPLVLVDDVAEALALALDAPDIEGQCFLLTDAPMLSARDYVSIVSREMGTQFHAQPTPIWKLYLADLIKELAKNLIRHPNRRIPSYRDWNSRSHRARYDSAKTIERLGWKPVGNRDELIARGIVEAVREFMA